MNDSCAFFQVALGVRLVRPIPFPLTNRPYTPTSESAWSPGAVPYSPQRPTPSPSVPYVPPEGSY